MLSINIDTFKCFNFVFIRSHSCNVHEDESFPPPGQRNIDLHRHEYKINCPQAVVASPPRLLTSTPLCLNAFKDWD